MQTTLIVATVIEVLLLVAALAVYLIVIDRVLRRIASSVEVVGSSIPALDPEVESVPSRLQDVNYSLEKVATALDDIASRRATVR